MGQCYAFQVVRLSRQTGLSLASVIFVLTFCLIVQDLILLNPRLSLKNLRAVKFLESAPTLEISGRQCWKLLN